MSGRARRHPGRKLGRRARRASATAFVAFVALLAALLSANTERTIIYANNSVKKILKGAEAAIRKQLPNFDADKMIGVNIDTIDRVAIVRPSAAAGRSRHRPRRHRGCRPPGPTPPHRCVRPRPGFRSA